MSETNKKFQTSLNIETKSLHFLNFFEKFFVSQKTNPDSGNRDVWIEAMTNFCYNTSIFLWFRIKGKNLKMFDFRFNTHTPIPWFRVREALKMPVIDFPHKLIGSFLKKISSQKNMKESPKFRFFYTPCT